MTITALHTRLGALEARLDARRRAEAAGQLALDLGGTAGAGKGPGGGEKCGGSWIDPNKTCRKGEGEAPIDQNGAPLDRPYEAKRSKPKETIVFPEPIVGPTGAKLTAYTWQWTLTEDVDHRGEPVEKRVSDWEKSIANVETGRNVVHQFQVEVGGETRTVSAESALKLMGFLSDSDRKAFGSLKSSARTVARLRMAQQELDQQEKRWQKDWDEVGAMSRPPLEVGEWSEEPPGWPREGYRRRSWRAGDVQQDQIWNQLGVDTDQEQAAHIWARWKAVEMEKRGWDYKGQGQTAMRGYLRRNREDLAKRLARAEAKLMAQARSDATSRIDSLLARLDALKRRCSTGYACGSACISIRKECRSEGGPGSRERIQRLEQLARGEIKPRGLGVPKAADAKAMAKRLRAELSEQQALLKAERKRQQAASANDVQFDISQSVLKRVDTSGAISAFESQELVYEDRGYNAKPEVVGTRQDLAKRSDLIQDPGGRPTILVRGVTNDDDSSTTYVEDFKRGDKHYVGWGNWGNGTYAASGIDSHLIAFEYTGLKSYSNAKETHGSSLNQEANKSVMAFGIKKSATVVQCSTMEEYQKFEEETVDKANQALRKAGNTSNVVSDLGLAAAIVGIDAYSLPAPSEFRKSSRYWVVLNRGAVVVAEDGQWT